MIVGVLRETLPETRVSLTPETVAALVKKKQTVWVEPGAGGLAFFSDADYAQAGAELVSRARIESEADVLLSMHPPGSAQPKPGQVCVGMYQPLYQPQQMEGWAQSGQTIFSLDLLPRTTRAQSMDVLSSQANIAGYKAVLLAAMQYPRYFPMFMTAAGSIAPAKLLVLGAGVAGLQAVATARRLGAVVEVFDTRPAVREEVMSLGAKFVEVEGAADASQAGGYAVAQSEEFKQRQSDKIREHARKSDIIITTAQIPGQRAPILLTEEMISGMRPGSVIVDLAASTGGNTELTENGRDVIHQGVRIMAASHLATLMPADASKLYSKNVVNFLDLLIKEDSLRIDLSDDLLLHSCIGHEGRVVSPRLQQSLTVNA